MPLHGHLQIPGDKSISHRALMLGALTSGECSIRNLNPGRDVANTRNALATLGIAITDDQNQVLVMGGGIQPFVQPTLPLDCGNSGTTARLLLGMLAGHPLHVEFTGDDSLCRRPMARVIRPLQQAGANISARRGQFLPLMLSGRKLWGLQHDLAISSAQVKSALVLAGLWAEGETIVRTPRPTRDHTERMLEALGARVKTVAGTLHVAALEKPLHPFEITIPGDFSAAAFLITAALLVPGSEITLENVGLNPTRTAFLEVVRKMGAEIKTHHTTQALEPAGDLQIRASECKAVDLEPDLVPNLIDEIPLLAVLATQAKGSSRLLNAEELRVKESDRIAAMAANLQAWGIRLEEQEDGLIIEGPQKLSGGRVQTFGDHRIAMAMSVAGLIAGVPAELDDPACMDISFPGFRELLGTLQTS